MKNNLQVGPAALSTWLPPDRSPMHVWAAKTIRLPKRGYAVPGSFSTTTTRYMEGPMAAIQDESVRKVTLVKSVQTGGTLCAAEIPLIYFLLNAPGDATWTHQSEAMARDHAKSRWLGLLKRIPQIKAMLPRSRHNDTTLSIMFPDSFLVLNAANEGAMQSKSCRYKINSEVWLWPEGLLAQAEARVSKYDELGTSKVINESQASLDGDQLHKAFLAGDQSTWSVCCFHCGQFNPLEFFGRSKVDATKLACVIWDDTRDADGVWDVARAAGSARWVCPDCGHAHDDTPTTRTLWNESGKFIPQRLDAPPSIRSFRWTALVGRSLYDLVVQFLEADQAAKLGLFEPLRIFKQQRLSLFWKNEEQFAEPLAMKGAGYKLSDANIADKIENESMRFMSIDRQASHWWVIIRAWRHDSSSRLLYFSKVLTVEMIQDLQTRFNVEPQLCGEDTGYAPDLAHGDLAKFGWTGLRGTGEASFSVEVKGVKFRRYWSQAQRVQKDGKLVPVVNWCSDPIKSILHTLRSGRGPAFEIPDDVPAEYVNQMGAERLKDVVDSRTKRLVAKWTKTRKDNHAFDAEAMQVLFALMTNVLAAPEPAKEPDAVAGPTA